MLTVHAVSFVYVPLFVAAGLALGAGYFYVLRGQVRHFVDGGSPWRGAAFVLIRVATAALIFWGIAHAGLAALLGAFVGFLAARVFVVIATGRSHD